jgi:putative transposase
VQTDEHFLTVMRYIEANPLRANIVKTAGDWPWSSFAVRGGIESPVALSDGPVELPRQWGRLVNESIESRQLDSLKRSFSRGIPFGESNWQSKTARKLGLESTMRSRGRPKKCTGHL